MVLFFSRRLVVKRGHQKPCMQCNLKESVGLEYQYPLFILAIHRLWDGDAAALSTAVSPKSSFPGPGRVENSANALLALEPQISPTNLAVKVSEQVPRASWLEGLLQGVWGPWVTICYLKLHARLYDIISWYFMYIQSLHKTISTILIILILMKHRCIRPKCSEPA